MRRHSVGVVFGASLVLLCQGAAMAQSRATKEEIAAALIGRTVEFGDGTSAIYAANGAYEFRGTQGERFPGTYAIGEGILCVKFPAGTRCDDILKDGRTFVLVNAQGGRYRLTIK